MPALTMFTGHTLHPAKTPVLNHETGKRLGSVAVIVALSFPTILGVVISETIGERHASACRYKNEVLKGSRRPARRTHFRPRGV